jgi:alkanesulfonate monooxygenase SsuD/methylene tetrahydromethanopterin reductase-like flavin-dependent oxidoreductase (luciferase family)
VGGSAGPRLLDHIAEFADGWLPIGGAGIRGALDELRTACDRHGRDADDLAIIPFGTIPDEGKLAYYAGLGIDEAVLRLPSAGRDDVLAILDDYTRFLA